MRNNDKHVSIFLYKGILFGAVMAALIGCGTTASSRLYTLVSLISSGEETPVVTNENPLTVQVGPLQLPKYLDRPQIVTRLSPSKIHAADFDRWAEPLKDNILRVLVENLSHLLWHEHMAVSSWEESPSAHYRVSVKVSRFDGQLGGKVFLIAGWTIYDKEKNQVLLEKRSIITEASTQPDYEPLVSAKSRALASLSREIAEDITSLRKNKEKNPGP